MLSAQATQLHLNGDYQAAMSLLEPQLNRFKGRTKTPDFALLTINVAALYDAMGDHDKALPMLYEGYELARELRSYNYQVSAALNLLSCLIDLGRSEEGLALAEEALSLGHFENTDTLRNNLAAAYRDLGRTAEVCTHYQALVEESLDTTLKTIAWARLASLRATPQKRLEAVEHAIDHIERTDLPVAHATVIIAAFQQGTDRHRECVAPYLESLDRRALAPHLQAELEAAVQT